MRDGRVGQINISHITDLVNHLPNNSGNIQSMKKSSALGPSRKYVRSEGGGGGSSKSVRKRTRGRGEVNTLAYVRFEKNSTSNCCFPTHIRVSYSFHRCVLGHTYARPGKVNMSNHFIITNYRPI